MRFPWIARDSPDLPAVAGEHEGGREPHVTIQIHTPRRVSLEVDPAQRRTLSDIGLGIDVPNLTFPGRAPRATRPGEHDQFGGTGSRGDKDDNANQDRNQDMPPAPVVAGI
mgnify:CR=1 FL=1